MYHDISEFLELYKWESSTTTKVLAALTDGSLSQAKAEGHNNLGDIAWHVATAPAFMLNEIKLDMPKFEWGTPEGLTVAKISETYADLLAKVDAHAANITPDDIKAVHHVFGMMDWPAGAMLNALIVHEVHHRGQMSVLMRQAGLVVPSIYGPNHEDTMEMMKKMQA